MLTAQATIDAELCRGSYRSAADSTRCAYDAAGLGRDNGPKSFAIQLAFQAGDWPNPLCRNLRRGSIVDGGGDVRMANKKNTDAAPTALELFYKSVESRTDDPVHRRLLKAAQKGEPAASVEGELKKIMEEILREA